MRTEVGKFSFKVPEGHPEAGKKIEKAFEYDVPENDEDTQSIMESKKWSLTDMVADATKANARASAYQKAVAAYQPVEDPDKVRDLLIKNYIRMGVSEEIATKQVDALLAANANAE